jgi:hypothetical protein
MAAESLSEKSSIETAPITGSSPALRLGMSSWPADAKQVARTMEGDAAAPGSERRALVRQRYRVAATLSSLSMEFGERAVPIFTRDVTEKGMGFLCRRSLATGTRAVLRAPLPGGGTLDVTCTIRRCRPATTDSSSDTQTLGWYEGAVVFSKPQEVFSPTAWTRGNAAEI